MTMIRQTVITSILVLGLAGCTQTTAVQEGASFANAELALLQGLISDNLALVNETNAERAESLKATLASRQTLRAQTFTAGYVGLVELPPYKQAFESLVALSNRIEADRVADRALRDDLAARLELASAPVRLNLEPFTRTQELLAVLSQELTPQDQQSFLRAYLASVRGEFERLRKAAADAASEQGTADDAGSTPALGGTPGS